MDESSCWGRIMQLWNGRLDLRILSTKLLDGWKGFRNMIFTLSIVWERAIESKSTLKKIMSSRLIALHPHGGKGCTANHCGGWEGLPKILPRISRGSGNWRQRTDAPLCKILHHYQKCWKRSGHSGTPWCLRSLKMRMCLRVGCK